MPSSLTRAQTFGYVGLCIIWGSTWLAIRVVVRDVPPFEAASLRFLAAGALLLALAVLQKRSWPATREQWTALLVLSFSIMAVPYGLLFWAEQYVTSSITAVLFSAMPLLVALFTPLMMRRTVPRRAVFAMLVAFGGLLVLFYGDLSGSRRSLLGGMAILIAVFLSAWSVVYAKQRLHRVDAVVSTAVQLLFGSLGLFWATWALESHQQAVWTRTAAGALAFLVVFGSCAAFVIYYWLLKKMQPYQLSTISLITPLVAVLEGALLLHEPVPLPMVLAIVVVLGSVATVLFSRPEQENESGKVLLVQE
jgi:drug/metabolite transporter (DMT)-like permease